MNPAERVAFIRELLAHQEGTCAFGDPNDDEMALCWNAPKNKNLPYVKLEWGHRIRGRNTLDNLYLLCARCNNQIQTRQNIDDLIVELEYKLQKMKGMGR
jgi:hypothetical protein